MDSIGIVGYGVVGKGIHRLLRSEVEEIYDPYINDIEKKLAFELGGKEYNFNNRKGFKKLGLVVINVPTNETKSGMADTSLVWQSLEWLKKGGFGGIFLIKSTTPPS